VTKSTGTLRLVDKKTRVVAVYGPLPPNGRRPRLLIDRYGNARPTEFGAFCIGASNRVAKFMIPAGADGDQTRKPGIAQQVRAGFTESSGLGQDRLTPAGRARAATIRSL
jgi:hypothetical protein